MTTATGIIQSPFVMWLYGLSGSGKTLVGQMLYDILKDYDYSSKVIFIDANELRKGVSCDLDYSVEGRIENAYRTAYICKLLNSQGVSCIVSMITALHRMRMRASDIIGRDKCHFIYLSTPLNVCIARDPKKVYTNRVPYLSSTNVKFETPSLDEDIIFTLDTSIVTKEEIQTILRGFVARRILRGEDDGTQSKFTCKA